LLILAVVAALIGIVLPPGEAGAS
jgi:hypothetical protein